MPASLAAGCDQAIALVVTGYKAQECKLILVATILASSLVFFDGAAVNIALPRIGVDLHTSGLSLQWLVSAYLLPMSALQLLAGALGDRYDRRWILILGVGLFTLASILCAGSVGYVSLLAARVLQGTGAALILPNSLAVLGAAYDGIGRGRAVGLWTAVGAVASAFGPPLAGWIVDDASWRFVFLLNVPIGLAALAVTLYKVPRGLNGKIPLDVRGTSIAAVGLFCMTWAVAHASADGLTATSIAFGLVAVVSFIVLIRLEKQQGEKAMIPLGMFGSRSFIGLNLFAFLMYASFGALFVLLPVVLIASGTFSATEVGTAILPLPLILGLASGYAGKYSLVYGVRRMLAIGAGVCAVGYAALLLVGGGGYWTHVFPGIAIIATGMAIVLAPATTAVLSSVDIAHTATAAGFNSTVSRVGSLVAIAASGRALVGEPEIMLSAFHKAAAIGSLLCIVSTLIIIVALRRSPLNR